MGPGGLAENQNLKRPCSPASFISWLHARLATDDAILSSRRLGLSFIQAGGQATARRQYVGGRLSSSGRGEGAHSFITPGRPRQIGRRRPTAIWLSQSASQPCIVPRPNQDRSENGAGFAAPQ